MSAVNDADRARAVEDLFYAYGSADMWRGRADALDTSGRSPDRGRAYEEMMGAWVKARDALYSLARSSMDNDRSREIDEEITRQQRTVEVSESLAEAALQDAENARIRIRALRRELVGMEKLPPEVDRLTIRFIGKWIKELE